MWIPFLLAGQINLDGTSAFAQCATGCIYSETRPALVVNVHRAYDPMSGTLLSPDVADVAGRRIPEGYALSRNNTIFFEDPSGGESAMSDFSSWLHSRRVLFGGCRSMDDLRVGIGIALAYKTVATCTHGVCTLSDEFRNDWLASILAQEKHCYRSSYPWPLSPVGALIDGNFIDAAVSWDGTAFYPPYALDNGLDCLAGFIAHEALHWSLNTEGFDDGLVDGVQLGTGINLRNMTNAQEEAMVDYNIGGCFACMGEHGTMPTSGFGLSSRFSGSLQGAA